MVTVTVRHIVDDVDAAIDSYCRNLGFHELMPPAATFAMLAREDLRVDGTGSRWRWLTWRRSWTRCAGPGFASATTSSPASEVGRCFYEIPPEAPSNCSRPFDARALPHHCHEVTAP